MKSESNEHSEPLGPMGVWRWDTDRIESEGDSSWIKMRSKMFELGCYPIEAIEGISFVPDQRGMFSYRVSS